MNQLVIFGTGAHARKACHGWVRGGGTVLAFADENPQAHSPVAGVPLWPLAELERQMALQAGSQAARPAQPLAVFVAIGAAAVRERLMARFEALGGVLPVLVHPQASVSPDAVLEAGVMVAAQAVVETGAHIGRGAIVDIGVLVDHDCRVAAFSHLRPGLVCPPSSQWSGIAEPGARPFVPNAG